MQKKHVNPSDATNICLGYKFTCVVRCECMKNFSENSISLDFYFAKFLVIIHEWIHFIHLYLDLIYIYILPDLNPQWPGISAPSQFKVFFFLCTGSTHYYDAFKMRE